MNHPNDELQFLRDLIEENATIAGDVLQISDNLWAIHGYIPVTLAGDQRQIEREEQSGLGLAHCGDAVGDAGRARLVRAQRAGRRAHPHLSVAGGITAGDAVAARRTSTWRAATLRRA